MIAINDATNLYSGAKAPGTANLLGGIDPPTPNWGWGTDRAGTSFDSDYGGNYAGNTTYRFYANMGATHTTLYVGQSSGTPQAQGAGGDVSDTLAATLDIAFGFSRWG